MVALANFHLDFDEEGNAKPHCHALMLTREALENSLSPLKNRSWNAKEIVQTWREQLAAYTNFHLKMHGFLTRVDHRSYIDQGIDLEPQPKQGRVSHMQEREGVRRTSLARTLNMNTARLLMHPEEVFKIIEGRQSTFMWGDVERILSTHVKDQRLFEHLNLRLLESRELVIVGEVDKQARAGTPISNRRIYTTKSVKREEERLAKMGVKLHKTRSHGVSQEAWQKAEEKANARLNAFGGLSQDQKNALSHMLGARQFVCVTGYAGAGKSTVLEAAKEAWEESGYQVLGLAPTGRARDNLVDVGLKAMTVHKFLHEFERGRYQLNQKSVLVLDEAGMVASAHFEKLLAAAHTLGVKLIGVGDSAQFASIEAGDAFRVLVSATETATLTNVVRQRKDWQRQASQAFGSRDTRSAVAAYVSQGRVRLVEEEMPCLGALMRHHSVKGVVALYNLTRRVSGTLYMKMCEDLEHKMGVSPDKLNAALPLHCDFARFSDLCQTKRSCVNFIMENLDTARVHMKALGVDPIELARVFTDREAHAHFQSEDVTDFIHAWKLPFPDPQGQKHVCDVRAKTRASLLTHWDKCVRESPGKSVLISSNSTLEADLLNQEARRYARSRGEITGADVNLTVMLEREDDFGRKVKLAQTRPFAVGDRIIFKKNDAGLGVSNGNFGRIESITKDNVKVRLDHGREVSFSPTLYNRFLHAFAVNTYATQASTVDYHFVLATHQDYENLTYVAWTRHREDVFIYGSSFDFWRGDIFEEVVSQSRMKLTSQDYHPTKHIARAGASYLTASLTKLGDHLQAAKYVGRQGWQDLTNKVLGEEGERAHFFVPQGTVPEHLRARMLLTQTQGENMTPQASQNMRAFENKKTPSTFTKMTTQQMSSFVESVTSHTDVAAAASHLLSQKGFQLNKAMSRDGQLRFGTKGSIVVNTQGREAGKWFSFEEGGGGNMIQLVQHMRAGGFKDALGALAPFVDGQARMQLDDFLAGSTMKEIAPITPKPHVSLKEHDTVFQIAALVERSVPIQGTLGEDYLKGRHIDKAHPKTLRFVEPNTCFKYKDKEIVIGGGGAIVSCAHDEKGELAALQLTYLEEDGTRAKDKLGNKIAKFTFGKPKGAFVTLQKEDGPLYVAEGVETALSMREAGLKGTIVASLGLHNVANISAEKGRDVVMVADWDGDNASSHKTTEKIYDSLKQKGLTVRQIWPTKSSDHKIDFNDLFMKEGADNVRQIIENQQKGNVQEISHTPSQEDCQKYLHLLMKNKASEGAIIPIQLHKDESSFMQKFESSHGVLAKTMTDNISKTGSLAPCEKDKIQTIATKLDCLIHLRHFATNEASKNHAQTLLSAFASNMSQAISKQLQNAAPKTVEGLRSITEERTTQRGLGL